MLNGTHARSEQQVTAAALMLFVGTVLACGPDLPDDLPALMALMARDDMNYHVNASNKVAEMYGKDGLLHVLRNGQQKARYRAARWLWRFPGEDVEEELLKIVVAESDRFLRIQALYSLGHVGTTRALDTLAATTGDSDESVARNARDAIAAIRLRSEK